MTALLYVLAAIGAWFSLSMLLLLVWIAANQRAGRRKVTGWDGHDVPVIGRGRWR